jgi:hypothetical protein
MGLDIRLPIGGMFFIVGLLLSIYGVATVGDQAAYEKSLYINVNLWWGIVMLAFGAVFLAFGIRGASKIKHGAVESPESKAAEARQH